MSVVHVHEGAECTVADLHSAGVTQNVSNCGRIWSNRLRARRMFLLESRQVVKKLGVREE